MFKINLLDVNVMEARQSCLEFDSEYIYTDNIYPELFNKPDAAITMVGKMNLNILRDLIKEDTIINTLYWY